MSRPVRIGIVGLGYWGPNLVRNIQELECAEVAMLCDAQSDRLEGLGRRYPAAQTTTSYDDILASDGVDAVVIATPVSTHHGLALRALDAGKHAFVEKPLAGSAVEALELIDLAERQNLVLMPGHTFVYSPPVVAIKEMIDRGDLGEIYFVSTSRVNLGLHQTDVSVVWDLAPHDFSILLYWLEESPSSVAALSRGCIFPETPDVAFINLEFPSGTVGHVELSWLAPSKLRRTTIVGSRQMVVYDDTSNEPVRVFDSGVMLKDPTTFGEYHLTYRTGDIVSPAVGIHEPLGLELADFCDAIQTGSVPRSSADLGLDVIRMVEAVERSLSMRGDRVPIPDVAASTTAASDSFSEPAPA